MRTFATVFGTLGAVALVMGSPLAQAVTCWNVTWPGGSSKQCAPLPMVWGSGGSKS